MLNNSPKTVLLVDDEEDVLIYLGNILRREGYGVLCAATGAKALELAGKKLPDVIILDILLPDIPGGDVAEKLSGDKTTSGIPIIFLSALMRSQEEDGVSMTGKRYILAKPAKKEDILSLVSKVLNPV